MGTTAEKSTYLNTTKAQIKDGINRLGGELTNLSTFRSYAEALDSIYNALPKVSGTGSNVSLSPTLKGGLGIVPIGGCEQDGTPTPDYPQNVRVVTDDNDVVVSSKNLWNNEQIVDTENIQKIGNGFKIIRTTSGRMSPAYPISIPSGITVRIKSTVSGNYTGTPGVILTYEDNTNTYNGYNSTRALTKNVKSVQFYLDNATATDTYLQADDFMIMDNANTDTTYVPFGKQVKTIHLSNTELYGIPNTTYKDTIEGYKDNWKIVRKISKVIVNGTEDWRQFWQVGNYVFTDNNIISSQNSINGLSNKLECVTRTHIRNNLSVANNMCAFTKGEFIISIQTITSVADFKTWLASNNITCYYILETPTEETITDTTLINELNELQNMLSYDGTTNITITSDSNNAQMLVQVSALKGE